MFDDEIRKVARRVIAKSSWTLASSVATDLSESLAAAEAVAASLGGQTAGSSTGNAAGSSAAAGVVTVRLAAVSLGVGESEGEGEGEGVDVDVDVGLVVSNEKDSVCADGAIAGTGWTGAGKSEKVLEDIATWPTRNANR